MAKEQFFYPATQPLFKKLEQLSHRSGISRGQAFEDWLTAMVCALAAETKEEEYLTMVERHKAGKPGHRGVDLMGQMFGELVNTMTESDADILGDLFQGSITYGEAGQYFTPESLAKLLSQMTIDSDKRPTEGKPLYIHDPCCGTGRMLLEAATVNSHAELVGVDIDARCARITAINLGLRGRYGWVLCGNSLSCEMKSAYRIGSFYHESPHGLRRGVIRDVPPELAPVSVLSARTHGRAQPLPDATTAPTAELSPLPKIIEVPQWLARLESRLPAMDEETPSRQDQSTRRPEEEGGDARTQQTLF